MRDYYLNNKKITKQEWTEKFKQLPQATVILRTQSIPQIIPPNSINEPVISAERAKLIRNQFKA